MITQTNIWKSPGWFSITIPKGIISDNVNGNWTQNKNSETDGFLYYIDISIDGITAVNDVLLQFNGAVSSNTISGGIVGDGFIRLHSNKLPENSIDCIGNITDGTGKLILSGIYNEPQKTELERLIVLAKGENLVTLDVKLTDILDALANKVPVEVWYERNHSLFTYVNGKLTKLTTENRFANFMSFYGDSIFIMRMEFKKDDAGVLQDNITIKKYEISDITWKDFIKN